MGEYDTVHTVELTDDGILINGQHLTFSATRDPKVFPWGPASKSEFDEINIFSAYTLNERANACVGSSNREAQGVLVPHFRHNDRQNTEKEMSVDFLLKDKASRAVPGVHHPSDGMNWKFSVG